MASRTPMFFRYFAQTYRVDKTPGGSRTATILSLRTGLFEDGNRYLDEVLWATSTSDITSLSEERFVQETEAARNHYLTGDGPIFALYETVNGIYELARKEGRGRMEPQEVALIRSLYKRTFKMWEEEAARRAAGDPPTFQTTTRWQQPDPEQ